MRVKVEFRPIKSDERSRDFLHEIRRKATPVMRIADMEYIGKSSINNLWCYFHFIIPDDEFKSFKEVIETMDEVLGVSKVEDREA